MTNETVTKSKRFYCVSLTPDICKTPVGASTPPLPYTIVGEFADATGASPNVKSHSDSVILHGRTRIPSVKGDAPGKAGGVKSGTVGKQVETKAFSSNHHANGADLVQVGREVWMNARNTVGKIYERGGESARPLLVTLSKHADAAVAAAGDTLESAAQSYLDDYSAPMHAGAEVMMEAGGKMVVAGGTAVGAGAVMTTTGVGAAVGAPAAAVGTGVVHAGGSIAVKGAMVETAATVLDHGAGYILTGKIPDLSGAALALAARVAQGVGLRKLGPLGSWLGSKSKGASDRLIKATAPGHKPRMPAPPKPPSKPPTRHADDGKSKGKKGQKSEPPSECCPKNKGPANKRVKGKKPIHFGTGQEVLHQIDFVTTGVNTIDWTRCYRSGAETEDWGMLGARWSTAFTTSVSLTEQGCVVHDETGRALRLPHLASGQSHDERKEGFILKREDADRFSLTWRDGSCDIFVRGIDGWLPHGYDGVNPMLDAGAPLRAERFVLVRSAARDGRGFSVAVWPEALPGELMLRVAGDDGTVLEAIREEAYASGRADAIPGAPQAGMPDTHGRPRIGRVEEVLGDGTRICHVRYGYVTDPGPVPGLQTASDARQDPIPLARSFNLTSQTDALGHTRTYAYHHHLLTACTSYTGFAQVVEWISLAALRARWAGSALDDAALATEYPITRDTSYQARAIASRAADGSEGAGLAIHYLDIDTSRVCENGDVLDYTFNANWLVTGISRVTDGRSTSLGRRDWDSNGMLLAETDSMGHTTRYTYDAAGNLTSSRDAAGYITRIAYDEANQAVAITDPMGHVSTRSYDAAGRLSSVTNALGHVTGYHYDDKGRLVEQIDAKGGVSRFEYDKASRLRTAIDCSGSATRYHYDERGRIAAVIEPEAAPGEQTRYTYDALGRLTTLTRPDGTAENYVYDAADNLLAHTDAMGHQTRFRYNGQGLLIERIDAIGQTVRYRYDIALRLVELANAKDEPYLLAYNADGELTSETGFDGKITNYSYDKSGQLTASECAGQRTELIRDSRGLLVAKTNADGIVRFAYDELGRMVAVAAPQAEHRFEYDALSQLVEERVAYYLVALPVVPAVDGSRVPDASFMMTHVYDELGNRIRTTLPNGRRVDTLRYGSGHWHGTLWQGESIVDVESDARHRERKRHLGRGDVAKRLIATREYDPQSRVVRMTLMHGAESTPGRTLRDRVFSYDDVGNLLAIDQDANPHTAALKKFVYTYDPVGQLLAAAQPDLIEQNSFDATGNLIEKSPFSRHQSTLTAPTDIAAEPLPVSANHLAVYRAYNYRYDNQGNVVAKRFKSPRATAADYDLALEYDRDDRIRYVIRNENQVRTHAEYFYDGFSRRIAKRVIEKFQHDMPYPKRDIRNGFRENLTLFVWDGDVLTQELSESDTSTYLYEPNSFIPIARITSLEGYKRLACRKTGIPEYDDVSELSSNNVNIDRAKKEATDFHIWPVRSSGLHSSDDVVKDIVLKSPIIESEEEDKKAWLKKQEIANSIGHDDRIAYYNCDQLGTPRELLDKAGKTLWISCSKVWGGAICKSLNDDISIEINKSRQPLRFQGQYDDAETGLFYNRYRFYDPDSARYFSQDPVGLLGGLNGYSYAPNPTGWIDPLGLAKSCPKNPECDPCFGKDPAAEARSWQGQGDYPGVDFYENKVIRKHTIFYSLYPGDAPGFAVTNHTLKRAAGDPAKFARLLQVVPGTDRNTGLPRKIRTQVKVYRVLEDICVGKGKALAQNPATHGKGGGVQYFISPSDVSRLSINGKKRDI